MMKIIGSLIVLLCLVHGKYAVAQSNTTTQGTDFWLGFMNNTDNITPQSLSVFIAGDAPATGVVEVPGQGWSTNYSVVPGVTTTVVIPNNIAEVISSQQVENKGVRITATSDVSVFAINFTETSADATKVLPITSIGSDYIIASYTGFSSWDSEFVIVATEDDTEIEILLSAPLVGMTPGNETIPLVVQLDRGQTYQCRAAQGADLTGTIIRATQNSGGCRPFSVFAGTGCAFIPANCSYCDHAYEQILPVQSWGTEYFMTPFQFAITSPNPINPGYTARVIAKEDDTAVIINGITVATLDVGEHYEINNQTTAQHIATSEPSAVAQYMQGSECSGIGDPSMLMLDASNQRINSVTFSTVSSSIITEHYINIVVLTEDVGEVTLDGTPIPASAFSSFVGTSAYRWASLEISQGSHHLHAPSGLNGYVYGLGAAESYAYSVGATRQEEEVEFQDVYCTGQSVTLNVPSGYFDAVWYNALDMNTSLHNGNSWQIQGPAQSAVYVAVANANVSGCPEEFYYSVESITPPTFTIEPGNTSICRYQSVQLNVVPTNPNATYEYLWSPTFGLSDATSPNPTATPYSTTTYTVTVSTPTGCSSASQNITITVNAGNITSVNASVDEPSVCSGESVQLSAIAQKVIWSDNFDPSISWGDWSNILNGASGTQCGSALGAALYFTGSGERSATSTPLNVSNGGTIYFSIKIADGVAPCDNAEPGDNVELRYSLDGVNFPAANTIMVLYENAYPEFTDIAVDIPAAAQSNATYFKWLQVGAWAGNQDNWSLDEVYVSANNSTGVAYAWSPSSAVNVVNFQNPIGTPTNTIFYTVNVTDIATGCVYQDSVQVVVNGGFEILLDDEIIKCNPGVMTLEATTDTPGNYTYSWNASDGSLQNVNQMAPVVNPLVNTDYTVTITSTDGCSKSASTSVLVSSLSSVELSSTDVSLCAGEQTNLQASIGATGNSFSIAWAGTGLSGNLLSPNVVAAPLANAEYFVTITDNATGCIKADSIEIAVEHIPVITLSETEITECLLGGYEIFASANGSSIQTWQWSPVNFVADANAASTTLTSEASGELTITATTAFGCSSAASIVVQQLIEQVNLGADRNACEGESVILNANMPSNYSIVWSNGEVGNSLTVTESGIYEVIASSNGGCESTDEVQVTFHEAPAVSLGQDVLLCEGESATIGVPEAMNVEYEWSTGANTASITVTESGMYMLTVSNAYCSESDVVAVAINPAPENPFSQYAQEFCFLLPPYVLKLDAENEGSTYLWEDGTTGPVFSTTTSGQYTVDITTAFGCEKSFSTFVEEVCPGYLYVPTAFTPDNDGLNDVWKVEGENISFYKLEIWNRWGELLFTSDSLKKPWLGQRRDGDEYVEPGVYVYKITYAFEDPNAIVDPQFEKMGNVTLIR